MSLTTILKMAVRNIYRHRGKNLLTGIVIFFASILFFVSTSLVWNAQAAWRDYSATTFLGRYHVTALEGLDRDYSLPTIKLPHKSIPEAITGYLDQHNIFWSKRIKIGAAVYDDQSGKFENYLATLIGVDFAKELGCFTNLEIIEGRRDNTAANGVLIWHELAKALNKKTGDEITLFIKDIEDNAYPYTFTIMGILGQKKSAGLEGKGVMMIFPLVFAGYQYVAEKIGYEDKIMEVAIWNSSKEHLHDLQKIADAEGLQLFHAEKGFGVLYGLVDIINFIGLILEVFVLIVLLVAGLNVNMMSYFDRQKEIGTVLAIGAKPSWIMALLLTELIVFATGVYAAATLAYYLLTVLFQSGFDPGGFAALFAGRTVYLNLVPFSVAVGYGVIMSIVLLSAVYPLYLSITINPIEVFREKCL